MTNARPVELIPLDAAIETLEDSFDELLKHVGIIPCSEYTIALAIKNIAAGIHTLVTEVYTKDAF